MAENDLQGKVAIVTGAAGGFGRALVKAFMESGLRVAAADIDAAPLKVMNVKYGSDRVLAMPFDISDHGACLENVQRAVDHFGGLHILVNNAAAGMSLVRPDHFTRTVQIEDIDVATWQHIIAVNLSGAFFLAKASVPIFRKQRWGRIINVTTSFFTMSIPASHPTARRRRDWKLGQRVWPVNSKKPASRQRRCAGRASRHPYGADGKRL